MKNKIHLIVNVDTVLIACYCEHIINEPGVTHTFTPNGYNNMGHQMGEYDIWLDPSLFDYKNHYIDLHQYQVITVNKKEYNEIYEKSRDYNIQKIVDEESEKRVNEALKKQRTDILKDVLNEYKEEIENTGKRLGYDWFEKLKKDFVNNEASYEQLCDLYKNKIEAEVNYRINTGYKPSIFKDDISGVGYFIRDFKNKVVDKIVDVTLEKRGMKDYRTILHKAGILADFLEGEFWHFYDKCINREEFKK